MKTHLKFLLGLVLMVLVFSGCEDPSRLEIPEGVKVEFVWGTSSQVTDTYYTKDNMIYSDLYRYFSDLHKDEEEKWVFEYPKGYDRDKYLELYNNEECLKKLYEDEFEKVFGIKYYEEGTTIDLEKWTLPAKDLISGNTDPYYMQLYFLAEDVGKTDYDETIYDYYIDYLNKNSFDEIKVHNQDIKVYVYWYYSDK